MSESANVRSLEAIGRFKAALERFGDEAANALVTLQMELDRAADWMEHDRPRYWQRQVQIGYHKIAEARTALATCRARRVAGRPLACLDEKIALRKAQQRLARAEEMVKVVSRWRNKLRHEKDEYKGRTGQLQRSLESDLPRMLALLDRMSAALESYVSVAPPRVAGERASSTLADANSPTEEQDRPQEENEPSRI